MKTKASAHSAQEHSQPSSPAGNPSVAISGTSSFTGAWLAKFFHDRGWKVHALLQKKRRDYTSLKKLRLDLLGEGVAFHESIRSEDGSMAGWIEKNGPDIWIHHHHWMEEFRAPDYDIEKARRVGLAPLKDLIEKLAGARTRGIIYSGTFFEPGEGGRNSTDRTTPYAQSKQEVWDELQKLCQNSKIPLSKVVIPNPIGPFENLDRMTCIMVQKAIAEESLVIRAPHAVSDYLPVLELCENYFSVAEGLLQSASQIARPSGKTCTTAEWVDEVNQEFLVKRLGLKPCRVEVAQLPAQSASFHNPSKEKMKINWTRTWDHYRDWVERAGIVRVFSNTAASNPSVARTK